MSLAEELIVAIRSEGVSDTRDDLEGVERSMEDTAESAGDASEDLEDFTARIKGAMSAAAAGVAIAAGALLTQIPIIGEFAAGLGAIFDALGLQVDQLIRDLGGGGLTDVLFNVANVINSAEGATADLVGALTILGTVVAGIAAGVAAFAIKTMGTVAAMSAFGGAIKAGLVAIGSFVAGLSAITVGLAAVVAAVAAFAVAYLTNFRNTRDKTDQIIGQIKETVVNGFLGLAAQALVAVSNFASDVRSAFNSLASGLSAWASDLAADARTWGRNLIERFIAGIESAIGRLREFLGDLRDIGANVGVDVGTLGGLGGTAGGGGGGGGRQRRGRFGRTGTGGAQIDGRQLSESTGRYRSDPSRRRGL